MMKYAVVAVVIGFTASVLAQDRTALLERVQRASDRASSSRVPASDRLAALDRAIEARSELMSAHPTDAHYPIWLLDQAADSLTRMTLTVADARLVVGLLDQWERDDALAAAEAAYLMADTAGVLIETRFEQHRGILEAGGELAEGDRALNRRLAETEQGVRRPLLMGRAMALQVAGGGDAADARKIVELLDGLRVGSGAARVIRDSALAVALDALGGPERRQQAAALLDGVIAEAPAESGSLALAEAALFRARLAEGVDARAKAVAEAADRAPFIDEQGLGVPALLLIAVEALARVLAEGDQLESAARALIAIEDRRDLGGTTQQWTAFADHRLASMAQSYGEWQGVAPDVVLRTARALVAQDHRTLDSRAVAMLGGLLERFVAEENQAREVGRAWVVPPERAPAMELLARLYLAMAEAHVDAIEMDRERERAVVLVWRLIGEDDVDLAGLLPQAATLSLGPVGTRLERQQRRELLEAALQRMPSQAMADRWRLGLAAMLIEGREDWSRALDLAEAAMRSADPVTQDDATALAGAAHALLVAQVKNDDPTSLETLRRALDFVQANPSVMGLDRRALGVRVARILVDRESVEHAREAVETLRGMSGKDVLILRARAMDVLGDVDQAFLAFHAASEIVNPQTDGETYWRVFARFLELLDAERRRRLSTQGEEAAAMLEANIRAQLLKLKAIDAELGGPSSAARLTAIEAGLDG